jgi:hypothetical protein
MLRVQLASWYAKVHKRKEVKTMKYETPQVTALTPAINAIQSGGKTRNHQDGPEFNDTNAAYEDWES